MFLHIFYYLSTLSINPNDNFQGALLVYYPKKVEIRTLSSNLVHRYAQFICHVANDSKDDKASKDAGRTVTDRDHESVPENTERRGVSGCGSQHSKSHRHGRRGGTWQSSTSSLPVQVLRVRGVLFNFFPANNAKWEIGEPLPADPPHDLLSMQN